MIWGLGEAICDVGLEEVNVGFRVKGLEVGLMKGWESRDGLVGMFDR